MMKVFSHQLLKNKGSAWAATLTISAAVIAGTSLSGVFSSGTASATRQLPPSVGRIPQSAFHNGKIDPSLVPDFVPALDHQGNVAGYVRKSDILPAAADSQGVVLHPSPASQGPIPVYDTSLTSVVGHMYPGVGFVPLGAQAPSPALRTSVTTTTVVATP